MSDFPLSGFLLRTNLPILLPPETTPPPTLILKTSFATDPSSLAALFADHLPTNVFSRKKMPGSFEQVPSFLFFVYTFLLPGRDLKSTILRK